MAPERKGMTMARSEKSQPSQPLVQMRLASMKADLDSRRLPGEPYSQTVRWMLRQYLDLMAECGKLPYSTSLAHVAERAYTEDQDRIQNSTRSAAD